MTDATKALYQFYAGFGLPAYAVGFVPDDAQLPYITFSAVESGLSSQATHYAQVWYPGTDNSLPIEKATEITEAIGDGIRLIGENGLVVVYPGTPLIQLQTVETDKDRDICYAYINLSINTYMIDKE